MPFHDLVFLGDIEGARKAISSALELKGYSIIWSGPLNADATADSATSQRYPDLQVRLIETYMDDTLVRLTSPTVRGDPARGVSLVQGDPIDQLRSELLGASDLTDIHDQARNQSKADVTYDTGSWSGEQRNDVAVALGAYEIPHRWSNRQLQVQVTYKTTVDVLLQAHILWDLEVIGGTGWAPVTGSNVCLIVSRLGIGLSMSGWHTKVVSSELLDIDVEGFNYTKGGGLFGGGFGVKGAVEGIVIASAVNKLTTKTARWVDIAISGTKGSVVLRKLDSTENNIRQWMRPARDAIVANPSTDHLPAKPLPATSDDLVSQLERLSKLKTDGLLTDGEFQSAKQSLLDSQKQAADPTDLG